MERMFGKVGSRISIKMKFVCCQPANNEKEFESNLCFTKKTVNKESCGQFHQHFMSAFAPIFFRQKSSNLKYKHKKASSETFVQKFYKMLFCAYI